MAPFLQMQTQYRASDIDKMKTELEGEWRWRIRHHPRWQTKMMIFSQKKTANFSLFVKQFVQWTSFRIVSVVPMIFSCHGQLDNCEYEPC